MNTKQRPLLLWVLLVGMVGTAADLTLLGHTEDRLQWIPLIALGVGVGAVFMTLVTPTLRAVRGLAVVMAGFIATSLAGLYFHFRGNVEFELEMYPSMSGTELIWESLTGATPALAPGSMALLGMIGLVYAFRHPVLQDRPGDII